MSVTLDSFNNSRKNFKQRYFLSGCNTVFGGQDIQVSWSSIASAVSDFISSNNVPAATVALRFVYCYDATTNELYLRLQICTMTADPLIPNQYNLNASPTAWYEIRNGSFASTTSTQLSDDDYFNYFYYCNAAACSAATVQNLAADTTIYAKNIVFPWKAEILQMYADNSSPANAGICFGACSFQAATPIDFPHSLVIYLRDDTGNALLDNTPTDTFEMKGADYGTLCPSRCNVYILLS